MAFISRMLGTKVVRKMSGIDGIALVRLSFEIGPVSIVGFTVDSVITHT